MGTSELVVVVGLLNWILGYWTGYVIVWKKLLVMMERYNTVSMAAETWLNEVEALAKRVKEEEDE